MNQCDVLLVEPSSPCPTADIRYLRSTQICCVARHAERADASYALYRGAPYVQSEEYEQFPFDPPLSDDGEAGAIETAHSIKNFVDQHDTTIHVVVSSPYLRCVQTAASICRVLGPSTILMFDASCGEIFGPSVISKEQPEHVYRDFNTILEECKARGVHRVAPVCVGTQPQWPETIPEGRQRFAESFLHYVQRGTDKARNFLVVTHGDCVAAAASLLPGTQDIRAVEPGGVLMASRVRPPGPGDAWSIISSERSDDKHVERVVLRTLSKAQGWKVDSINIDFCSARRSKESMIKRITSSLRKFSAKTKLGEDRVKYLLKAFSGERRRQKGLGGSPLPTGSSSYGTQGPDPALWVFGLEENDSLHRMPKVKPHWAKTLGVPGMPPSPGREAEVHVPAPAYAPAFSRLQLPTAGGFPAGDAKPQTLLSVIKGNGRSGVYEASEATTMATEDGQLSVVTHSDLSGGTPVGGKGYLQLPGAGGKRGPGINDISSSPLWKRRQQKTNEFTTAADSGLCVPAPLAGFALPNFLGDEEPEVLRPPSSRRAYPSRAHTTMN